MGSVNSLIKRRGCDGCEMLYRILPNKSGADPLGGPQGPWPPQLGQGAPTQGESAPDFGKKYCSVPQLEGKSAPNLGANDVKCPS